MKSLKLITGSLVFASGLLVACTEPEKHDFDSSAAIDDCHEQVLLALSQLESTPGYPEEVMPRNIAPGEAKWNCRPTCAEEWCSGFWPGILWLDLMNHPNDTVVRKAAIRATMAMEQIIDKPVVDHDLGFLMYCSAGTALKVMNHHEKYDQIGAEQLEENRQLKETFKSMLLRAADSLATLYRPTVGTILSWPRNVKMFGGHNTIIDNMINLELLYWAAKNGGSDELEHIATKHADTTMKNHFRPDGSCYHVAVYDTLDGHFIKGVTHQGLTDSSMWARGQSWAVYGYTMAYRETGNRQFLDRATKAADIFISRLPEDHVPVWDFDAPADDPRDASAAAVVASALLELSANNSVDPSMAKQARERAVMILKSLTESYSAKGQSPAFLLHSVGSKPANSEVDYSIVYADYYYLEALTRLNSIQKQ